MNEQFFDDIHLLSPFGPGNADPVFVLENVRVINSTLIANKHIKTVMIGKNGEAIKGIAFNSKGSLLEPYLSTINKKSIHVAGKLTLSQWHGKKI